MCRLSQNIAFDWTPAGLPKDRNSSKLTRARATRLAARCAAADRTVQSQSLSSLHRCRRAGIVTYVTFSTLHIRLEASILMRVHSTLRESLCRGDISVHDLGRMDNLLKVHI
jgi:hypothetical protein